MPFVYSVDLRQCLASQTSMWNEACVGAGLPAMQATRCIRYTEVMLSQASQLPQFDPIPSLDWG
ncbi:hypothetical protein EJJ20_04540 [Pseudomonas poae]|nr:hypothetical protein EJJ20_04540 [Pseudomonas poae]